MKLIKRLLPFSLKKQLVNALALSKLDYGNSVYIGTTPAYLLKRLQKVQNAAAGFVLQRHTKIADVIKLSWLPVLERYKYAIAVLAFKALHEIVPDNMQVKRKINHRTLRTNTNNTGTMIDCNDSVTTFQAKTILNDLPKAIKDCNELNEFKNKTKKYLVDKALARAMI